MMMIMFIIIIFTKCSFKTWYSQGLASHLPMQQLFVFLKCVKKAEEDNNIMRFTFVTFEKGGRCA